jgi:hypothetical protein
MTRYALTNTLLVEARRERDAGATRNISIDHPRGLFIRVRRYEASFYAQARGRAGVIKRRLGLISAITIADVKILAEQVIKAAKAGRDPDAVIDTFRRGIKQDEIDKALDRADAEKNSSWKFGQAIDAYLARTVTRNGVIVRRLSDPAVQEIRDRLRNRKEAAGLMGCYLAELGAEDFEKVQEAIEANSNGASNSAKFIDLSKRVLRWAAKYKRRLSALDITRPWWEALAHEWKPADRSGRFLTTPQLGMLIALLEGVRTLEERSNDAVFGAIQADLIVVQRVSPLVAMESLTSQNWKDDPAPDRKGWRVYTWKWEEQKGKREVKLSVPPQVIDILERVATNARKSTRIASKWAFPQARHKYLLKAFADSGNSQAASKWDKHITDSSINQALAAIAGKKKGWPNLCEIVGLPDQIGSHDLRKSLTTFFENRGLGAYASALLDHKTSGIDKMSEEVAAVTQEVYSAGDRVEFKAEGLSLWMAAVLPEYEKAKADPRLKAAIDARRASLLHSAARGRSRRLATMASKQKKGSTAGERAGETSLQHRPSATDHRLALTVDPTSKREPIDP